MPAVKVGEPGGGTAADGGVVSVQVLDLGLNDQAGGRGAVVAGLLSQGGSIAVNTTRGNMDSTRDRHTSYEASTESARGSGVNVHRGGHGNPGSVVGELRARGSAGRGQGGSPSNSSLNPSTPVEVQVHGDPPGRQAGRSSSKGHIVRTQSVVSFSSSGKSPHVSRPGQDADAGLRASTTEEEEQKGSKWFDSSSRCHSGESQSTKFTMRVWAGMDAAHIRFRVGGAFLEDEKKAWETASPNSTEHPPQRPSARWPNAPLLMHLKQFMVYNRTAGRMQMRDWVQVKGTAFRMHFDPVFLGMLPTNDRMWRYDTCAVVGNSGAMLRGSYGQEIDDHSAVFRINYAPTRTFERYVGSRTTFDIVNQQHTKAFLPNIEAGGHLPTAKRAHYRQSILTVFEVDKEFARRHLYAPLMKKLNGHSRQHGNVAILSPDFVYHAHKVWKVMKALVENASAGSKHFMSKPMSGFFAVLFAVQVCDKVSLYGFSPYKKGDQKYHYFDQVAAVTTSHSFDLGFEVFRQMSTWPCSGIKLKIHN
mmetsp:Transcript_22810/g.70864  ORF Transcript_22810/g.70864 Transcript_22810/m.70864 type:complete len:532 (+) Transcript_22810:95-1690(+)